LQVAERFGAPAAARWLLFERVPVAYWSGRWDEALQMLEETLADVGPAHALSRWAFEIRGRVRLARGATAAPRDDAQRSLELARDAKDPQTLCPALSFAAVALLEAGQHRDAALLADELLALDVSSRRVSTPVSPIFDLAWVLHGLGRTADLIRAAEHSSVPSPWSSAAAAIARGDYLPAADIYEEIGHLPNEAYTRLRAAEKLLADGRQGEADEQLQKALGFYRGVGATRYIREGEALLPLTA
jgi:tetratricopeptide (TPR) repeat protein